MTNYRYLGYGVTNENGVAKLEYNSEGQKRDHSYVGVGAGEIDVVASLDNPVSSGSIVSETLSVWDTIKYDKGNTVNTLWSFGNNDNAQLDVIDNSYRKLSEITTGSDAWVYLKIDHSCACEFDAQIVATNYATSFFQLGQSPNASSRIEKGFWDTLRDSNWHHIKLSISDGQYSITSPDSSIIISDSIPSYDSSQDMYFRFRTLANVTEINFKEFKYYSI